MDDGTVLSNVHFGSETAYVLRIDGEYVDAHRFEQLVSAGNRALSSGQVEQAAGLLRQALALWRGRPLADVADRWFAQDEVARLEGVYRAAVMARIEADVELGRQREVTEEIAALTRRLPDDLGLRQLYVVALYRSARPVEAASACRDAVTVALEHGLDVAELTMLQRKVLQGTLALHGPVRK